MHLYYLFTDTSEWTRLDEELLRFVSEERRKKIRSFSFPKEKKQSLFAALLLPFACTAQYHLPFSETDPLWPRQGRPFLVSHPGIHFSIAHSGSCAAVAVSDEELGLDAELISRARQSVLKRAFSPAEADQIQNAADPDLEFFRFWTRKEAYGKYLGTGLSPEVFQTDTLLPRHNCRISEGVLTPKGAFSGEEFLHAASSPVSRNTVSRSSALYYSVYGKKCPAELIQVSLSDLMEYYPLCI